ncbi:hypothetical protein [Palleronia caenipelagi]|uniref:hypothetical protein n=1 Tax=Palleronia caenipelagi TaxID=2489174 RepID=UPI00115C653A|nr:hypothetical protein [Palleronia caenipelagi]
MMVLSAIGASGPISLTQLCDLLPVPRTAIWRATAILRDFGWVRIRLADNRFELTSACDLALANSHFSHPASDRAAQELLRLREEQNVDTDAGLFVAPGKFEIIESTRSGAPLGQSLSLISEPFALSVQAAMPADQLLRHLRAFQRTATPEDAELISSGAHAKTILAIRERQSVGESSKPIIVEHDEELLFLAQP